MQLKMITTPNPGDVLTPQFFGDKVEIRANMTGKTGSGKLIAEGTPPEYSERWHEYKDIQHKFQRRFTLRLICLSSTMDAKTTATKRNNYRDHLMVANYELRKYLRERERAKSPEAARERKIDNQASQLAAADLSLRYPNGTITPDNFEKANAYLRERQDFWQQELRTQ